MVETEVTAGIAAELDRILAEPVDQVRERERTAFDVELAACGGRIVLFGAGNLGRKAVVCLRGTGIEPQAFADNGQSKWGTKVEGVPVMSPKEAAEKYGQSALFVVTIWSEGHFYSDTKAMLERAGCARVLPSAFLRWKFADRLLPDYCNDLPHKLYEQAADVRRAGDLWADELSRQEYLNHMRWRALGDLGALGRPVKEESYFLDSLYRIADGEVFVDCGAYNGITAQEVIRRNPAFGQILAIEADPGNFGRLSQWLSTLDPMMTTRIKPFRVAVGATRGRLRFRASGDLIAHISEDGDVVVECEPLDELLEHEAPTFIKMDIEGAEMDALAGARRVIQQHRPILSICVYHRQDDLWRVPLFVHSLVEDYRFYLRPHDVDGWQLVCYAVPKHRMTG